MKKVILTGLSLAALVVWGCASTPQPNATLESARGAVNSAEADPNVPKYDAVDLETAKKVSGSILEGESGSVAITFLKNTRKQGSRKALVGLGKGTQFVGSAIAKQVKKTDVYKEVRC